ncbi:SPOR domain-containing protein [Novosphingobium sp.]|uniref:SPOR domain-containing protein n=1 Tax=Novosphingobium sp. TaxID=1874826 RepID=UPI00286B9C6F|nr:SPOR domain-containing protein [Novosphingobium sp.]
MGRKKIQFALALGLAAILAAPAWADTKAGVDAWTHGDFTSAVKFWEIEAAKGDSDAVFNLGQAYKLGKGVKQDLAKAEALFAQAAAAGHLQAADNYGLLLFQRGERAKALPYLRAAADRGDPRAQYLLGIMHFNGELVPKDWVRAYALVTLAQQQGLPQAGSAMTQMNEFIPIEQRQQGVQLAGELASQADATRARQLAAVDLGTQVPAANPAATPVTAPPMRGPVVAVATPAPTPPPRAVVTPPKPSPAPRPVADSGGTWRIQLGAFGQPANANVLWAKVKGRPEVAGHARIDVRAGAVTKLQAGGYSPAGAQAACGKLKAAGYTCVAVAS